MPLFRRKPLEPEQRTGLNVPKAISDAAEIAVYGPGSIPIRPLDQYGPLPLDDGANTKITSAATSALAKIKRKESDAVKSKESEAVKSNSESLTASAMLIGSPAPNPRALAPSAQEWQREALTAPQVNETVAFAASSIETMARHVRFNIEKMSANGVWVESADYNEVLISLRDDSLSQEGMIGSSVRYIFLAGEVYLSVYDGFLPHIVPLSPVEVNGNAVRRTSILGTTYDAASYSAKTIGAGPNTAPAGATYFSPAFLIRAWIPDDLDGKRAFSNMRAASGAIRELQLIDDLTVALLTSRISGAGILLIPDETSFGDDVDDTSSYLSKAITDVASLVVAEPSLPEAHVPIVVTAPSELIASWTILKLSQDTDEKLLTLRADAVKRVERAVDLPELVLNPGNANHWSLAASLEIASNYFVARAAQIVASALTIGLLVPVLPDEEIGTYRIGVVLTGLVSRARAVADALQLWDRGLISDSALREVVGYDDSDGPAKKELGARMFGKIAVAQPTTFGVEYLKSLGITVAIAPSSQAGGTPSGPTGTTQQARTGIDPATVPLPADTPAVQQ